MISENLILLVVAVLLLGSIFLGLRLKNRKTTPELKSAPVAEEVALEVKPKPPESLPAKLSLATALSPTRKGWIGRLTEALAGPSDKPNLILDQVEEILFSADIGVKTSAKLLEIVKQNLSSVHQGDVSKVRDKVSEAILEILQAVEVPAIQKSENGGPCVVMFVGVNGVGKTTSIGKLAAQFAGEGSSVVLGAGDTFRAAAAEQLEIWANRSGASIVRGQEQADPSSVLFDAVNKAKNENADFVLCDTAGRLHTKINLMEELKKVHRVLGKACEGAPHEVLLVVDATTGQNAIEQARQFKAATSLTGVILTKLDGTAKGGVVIGIADELGIPIRYIGVGEGAADLRAFDAEEFVKVLFEQN